MLLLLLLGIYPAVALLDHGVIPCLILGGASILSSTPAVSSNTPDPRGHLLFPGMVLGFGFQIVSFLMGVRGHLIMGLIWLLLMTSDMEHLFICLLAMCTSSLEKGPFKSSERFLMGSWFCRC